MYLGIDGGGTKTRFTLVDENFKVLCSIDKGTTNFKQVGFENLAILINQGILEIKNKYKIDNLKIGIGLSGYGRVKSINDKIDFEISKYLKNYYLTSDIYIALVGALNFEKGINLISGTGSVGVLLDENNELIRCGGFGYQLGDEGSAYFIGKELLRRFTNQVDGRLEKTKLYDSVRSYLKIEDDYDIIAKINTREDIASFSKICFELAEIEEKNALEIFDSAGYYLSEIANNLAKRVLDNKVKMTTTGSVFLAKKYLNLERYLDKKIELVDSKYPPDIGACILAKKYLTK